MAAASPLQLSPAVVGAIQWTLAGIELLVLAWVVAWIGRHSRLGRLVRPFRRRTTLSAEEEVAGVRRTRLVSGGGHAMEPVRSVPAPRPASRTPRLLRTTRTPIRSHAVPASASAAHAPAALHCPGCGTLLARGEVATRLVTRCPGCDRRVAVRHDGARVVVTIEG